MEMLKQALMDWLKEILTQGILSNLSGLFDGVNEQVGSIAGQVGLTPQAWNSSIYTFIRNLSETVIVPIAAVMLAFVMTLELIRMIVEKNSFHGDVDTWMFFKWIFKTAAAILIVTNTWNLVMAVFDAAQRLVSDAAGVIVTDASVDVSSAISNLSGQLEAMELGPLFGLWFQSLFVGICTWALTICVFVITYGRMIEIYLVTSAAPLPMAAMMSSETGGMGQNYLRSLLALGLQGFLMLVCVGIYAVLVRNISVTGDIIRAIWTCMGYTVLLCFTLFKTGSVTKSIFSAH